MSLYKVLEEYKFSMKLQPLQYWNVDCVGWLYRYTPQADIANLKAYFTKRDSKIMKSDVKIAVSVKNTFIEKSDSDDSSTKFKLYEKKYVPNKGIYLECLSKYAIQAKRVIKSILSSSFWANRYGVPVKLILKWNSKINIHQQERIAKAAIAHF